MRIVDDEQVSSATSDVTANTSSVILSPIIRFPAVRRFTVNPQPDIGEYPLVLLRLHQVLNLTTKPCREVRRMRRLHNLLVRHTANEPAREQKARELRLRMSRRHVDNQPLQLTTGYPLQLLRNDLMVVAGNKTRPYKIYIIQKVGSALFKSRQFRRSVI